MNALKNYKRSIEIFDERITDPGKKKYLKAHQLNRAILLILMGQGNIGRNELKKLKETYASEESLNMFSTLTKLELLDSILSSE